MKITLKNKVTGILVAVCAAAAFSAGAQTTATPADAAPATQAPAAANAPTMVTPDATAVAPAATAPAVAAPNAAAPATMANAPAVADASADNAAKTFVREAFLANEFSIAASQVAVTQAQNPEVKSAAQTIAAAGLKTRDGMIKAIQGSTSDMHFDQSWSADYTAKLADLKMAKGADFDAKYVATQGEVVDMSQDLFKAYATTGTDVAVKTFAENSLPTLQANADALGSVSQGGN